MKLKRILFVGFVSLFILLIAGITLTVGWRPFIGPRIRPLTSRRFQPTTERLERGKYIFSAVCGCASCHSQHDYSQPGWPIVPGTEGAGNDLGTEGLPGHVVAPNISSDPETGAGNWTDDQLARAIREGIAHDGRALFPLMPYDEFKQMSDEDLASVIVYMRSLPPARRTWPKTEIIFPVKYLIRAVPQPITAPIPSPDPVNRVKYGAYLVNIGGCRFCHTPQLRGQAIAGMEFSGGNVFMEQGTSVASANITPDPSGISYYDEGLFLQAIRTGSVRARKLSPIMPFAVYRYQTDDDLKAIFAYLRTLKPAKHRVDNGEPPTYCRLCRTRHGAGNLN